MKQMNGKKKKDSQVGNLSIIQLILTLIHQLWASETEREISYALELRHMLYLNVFFCWGVH